MGADAGHPGAVLRTQVGIVGAGPAGLLLAQLLQLAGIESVVLERRSVDYVLGRVRAGVLEQGTVQIVRRAQAHARMEREGLEHRGVELCFAGGRHRIDFGEQGAARMLVYGQDELSRDLVNCRRALDGQLVYEAENVHIEGVGSRTPTLHYRHRGRLASIRCDFIAGCDGFHGISRRSIPPAKLNVYERIYPFAWLGVMADVPPVSAELVYVNHDRGFALCSMRSLSRSRCYVQCAPDDRVEDWSDERFWDELRLRLPAELARRLITGPAIEKSIAAARSFVVEPLRFGQLFLAGDAAHIVPPTGAKGLNLAAADVSHLADALIEHYREGSDTLLETYSTQALLRIWRAERFSCWLTTLLHRFPGHDDFDRRMQHAELAYLVGSRHAQAAFSQSYVGLSA